MIFGSPIGSLVQELIRAGSPHLCTLNSRYGTGTVLYSGVSVKIGEKDEQDRRAGCADSQYGTILEYMENNRH